MLRYTIVVFTGLAIAIMYDVPYNAKSAEACGVKLTVKSPRVKKRVRRTSHPSNVLVLGRPPSKKLARWLKQAGHKVEITKNPKKAKKKKYAIVIADAEKVNEARSHFPTSRVVTRSGSLSSNVRKIESVLAKNTKNAGEKGERIAARKPVERPRKKTVKPKKSVEPVKPKKVETPGPKKVETPVVDPKPDKTEITTDPVRPPIENKTTDPEPVRPEVVENPPVRPDVKPRNRKKARFSKEVYFGTNRNKLSRGMKKKLLANIAWLEQNPDVNVTIEGHTDASGPDEFNKLLGERRAEAVRAFLVDNGIDDARLEVISYGEERPEYKSSRRNRRVKLVKN